MSQITKFARVLPESAYLEEVKRPSFLLDRAPVYEPTIPVDHHPKTIDAFAPRVGR